jgi:hypothetical protein
LHRRKATTKTPAIKAQSINIKKKGEWKEEKDEEHQKK